MRPVSGLKIKPIIYKKNRTAARIRPTTMQFTTPDFSDARTNQNIVQRYKF